MDVLIRNTWRDMQRRGHGKMGSTPEQRGRRRPEEAERTPSPPPPPGPCDGADTSLLASGLGDREKMNELSGVPRWGHVLQWPQGACPRQPWVPSSRGPGPWVAATAPPPVRGWGLGGDSAGSRPCFGVPPVSRLGRCQAVCMPQRREGAPGPGPRAQPPTPRVALTVSHSHRLLRLHAAFPACLFIFRGICCSEPTA